MTDPIIGLIFADIGGLLLLPVALLAVAFWIWMIVDCAKRETDGSTKIVWMLVILLAGVIGAPLYFFVRRAPRSRSAQYQPPRAVHQPWQKDVRMK